jgi:hypothetical protein
MACHETFVVEKTCSTYMIDDQAAGLFRVNRRAFTDPECLAEERARLFDRCWIYVGHESEVPHAGDYIARTVAGRPMILVRRRPDHSLAAQHLYASWRSGMPPEVGQREDVSMPLSRLDV